MISFTLTEGISAILKFVTCILLFPVIFHLTIFQIHKFNHVCKCHCRRVIQSERKQSEQGEYLLTLCVPVYAVFLFYREQSFSPRKLTKSKIWLPFAFRKYLVKGVAFTEENDQNTQTGKFPVHSQSMSHDLPCSPFT